MLEATRGSQRAVVAALAAAGLPVVVVNPRQAHTHGPHPQSARRGRPHRCDAPSGEAPTTHPKDRSARCKVLNAVALKANYLRWEFHYGAFMQCPRTFYTDLDTLICKITQVVP